MGSSETPSSAPPQDPIGQPGRSVRRVFVHAELVEASFLAVLENAFDKAHLPFIHRGSFGPHQDPRVARQRITVDADGRALRAEDDPDAPWHVEPKLPGGLVGWLGRLLLGLRTPVTQQTQFDVERGVQIYQEYPAGTFDLFLAHITPADAQHTWLFVESVRTRAPHVIGDWIQRRAINKVFEEGKRETSLILDAGPEDPQRRVSVESDRLGLAARQLYEHWAGGSRAPAADRDRAAG
jgi:hypothetical protein